MKKVLLVADQTLSLEEMAAFIEQELKMNSTGLVVGAFRDNEKIPLLKEIIPFLSKGNQSAIDDVLSQNRLSVYY